MNLKAIISDFSRVVLLPKDPQFQGSLNEFHKQNSAYEDYVFWDHFVLNDELLNFYEGLKQKFEIYLFTSGNIQESSEIKIKLFGKFEAIYKVEDIGVEKKFSEAYVKLADTINRKPEEILYIDDLNENIEAAKLAGMLTHQYVDNHSLMLFFQNTLN